MNPAKFEKANKTHIADSKKKYTKVWAKCD